MPFQPGISGNPNGRRPGQKNRKAALIESLFEGEVEAVGRKTLELALAGDTVALKIILDRVAPAPRGRKVRFRLPQLTSASDLVAALNSVLRAVSHGILTVDEGSSLSGAIESGVRVIEVAELGERIAALEARLL